MEFPEHIITILDYLDFKKVGDTYVGKGQNFDYNRHLGNNTDRHSEIIFALDEKYLTCSTSGILIFGVLSNIRLGALLYLLQNFGIIHERFLYENMDYLEETFEEIFN